MTDRPERGSRRRAARPDRTSKARPKSVATPKNGESTGRSTAGANSAAASHEAKDRERRREAREAERLRVSRSRRKLGLIAAAVVAVIVAGFALVYLTPVLSVRKIEVTGNVTVSEEEIVADLDILLGEKLVRVDVGSAAQRVAAIPAMASVRVQRMYPSTVRVTVTERVPVAFVDEPDGTHLLDKDGVDFAVGTPLPGVVRLVTDTPGPGDAATTSGLAVLDSMPDALRGQVGEVRATSISEVSLSLLDGRTLVWGSSDNSERKSAVALTLLSQPGQVLDVSSPDLPTIK
ncbi:MULTISPECIES: FtsQ-type POTRA domain-containing protein [unclassified Rhodococcus (in: high G+C Gram-positive bacteria)]|uniref:cell division protein FtsQ/DivIB n=1 Tax=unclassified Rhodococcus (in: high G+C Gram-positive bacteria) TaxID=192944 RepID=UPI003391E43F